MMEHNYDGPATVKLFNADAARELVASFHQKQKAEAIEYIPTVLKSIEAAARRGQTVATIDIKYKHYNVVSAKLVELGFRIKLSCQGRDGDDNSYEVSWL